MIIDHLLGELREWGDSDLLLTARCATRGEHPRGGRAAAFEVLVGTSAVRNLIREGKTRQIRNMISTGHREGMQTLEASLNTLVTTGTVAYEQAVRHTAHPEDIRRPHVPVGPT